MSAWSFGSHGIKQKASGLDSLCHDDMEDGQSTGNVN